MARQLLAALAVLLAWTLGGTAFAATVALRLEPGDAQARDAADCLTSALEEHGHRVTEGMAPGEFTITLVTEGWRRLRELLGEQDRSQQEFGAEYLVSAAVDPQAAADLARRWEDEAGTHVGIRTLGYGFTEPERHIAYLAEARALLG
jgi:hypothetical protein